MTTVTLKMLREVIEASEITITDRDGDTHRVFDVRDALDRIEQIERELAMLPFQFLVGKTLDEAVELSKVLGVKAFWVSRNSSKDFMHSEEYMEYIRKHIDPNAVDKGLRKTPDIDNLYRTPGTLRISLRYRTNIISRVEYFVTEQDEN